ncbi:hypothetical protein EYB31_30735 [Paenibacillus thalictri]|uniref:Putative amidase domain-containing protein n=2 Tax=Paenibacillus thalictri TaxID=2527873 RepID=A0A4Q9DIV4_9BACL|nr:hypothetical protein EYB31_30735 [Paenibacillus thalictri]
MEIDYSIDPLAPHVEDAAFLQDRQNRLLQLQTNDEERRSTPVKNETRLRIVRADEQPDRVVADIALKRTIVAHIRGQEQSEQRIELQRLELQRRNEHWHITRIQDTAAERGFTLQSDSGPGMLLAEDPDEFEMMSIPSVPYLNHELLRLPDSVLHRYVYDRTKAVQYADRWWNGNNPAYTTFEVDCTSFISQCLFAGGAPMNYTGKRNVGWWYKGRIQGQELWSFSWAVSNSFQWYLTASRSGLRAVEVESPWQLTYGDVIVYDWDGSGRFQHSTIVTAFDPNGMPLVNAHTVSSQHRYWQYIDSPAWTPRTRYRFLHIVDS